MLLLYIPSFCDALAEAPMQTPLRLRVDVNDFAANASSTLTPASSPT